jgi:hypothetical protein
MAAALRRTLPTLLASSGTVICAMLCLLAAQSAARAVPTVPGADRAGAGRSCQEVM